MSKPINNNFLPILFAAIMLSPNFRIFSSLPSFRIEDILIFVSIFYNLNNFRKLSTYDNPITKNFMFLFFAALLSIILMEMMNEILIIKRDLFIIPQLCKYWLIFLMVKSIELNQVAAKHFAYGIVIVGVVMAIISFCQYYNLLRVNNWLTPLYEDAEVKINALLKRQYWRRVVGTSINANYFGYLLVSTIGCITAYILHCPRQKAKKYLWLILSFIGISSMFTLSRTVIITIAFLIFIVMYFVIKYQKNGIMKALHFAIFCSFAILIFFFYFRTEGFLYRVSMDNLKTHGSLHARKRDLIVPFTNSLDSVQILIFGQGPSKSTLRTDSHNGFGWFFQRYGLLGLLGYLSLILIPLRRAIRLYHFSVHWLQKFLSMASILVVCNWASYEMAMNIFKNPQAMSLAVFFIGISYACSSNQTMNHFNKNNKIVLMKVCLFL